MRRDTSSNQQKCVERSHLIQAIEQKRTVKNTNTCFIFSIVILLILIIVSLTLKYWQRLRGTSCTRMIPWRNGEQTSPGPAAKTLPQPRARKRFPLSRIPEETDQEITEEAHLLNLTTYSDAVPLQVDPARLATSMSPRADRKETKPTDGNNHRKFSRPGLFQPSTRN
jgi:predicted nucleic acid-binding Zn ribbon protein